MKKSPDNNGKQNQAENPVKHPHETIVNPETGEKTEGEIGSLSRKSAAQNPERQKKEKKKYKQ